MSFGAYGSDAMERISGESLTSVSLLQCLLPEFGRELKNSALRPVWKKDEDVAEIAPRFDSMETSRSDERCKDTIPFTAVFASQEEPIFPADHLLTERPLAVIVVNGDFAVFEKLKQGFLLIPCILESFVKGRMLHGVGPFFIAPGEKLFGNRFRFFKTNTQFCSAPVEK